MSPHLRFAGQPHAEQTAALLAIVRRTPMLCEVLDGMRRLALPDCWLVSGAIYNTVWNDLTGRPPLTGIKDVDLFYFAADDLSYEAEDREIQRAGGLFAGLPLPVQLRNQARVHLWYEDHFGQPYPPLRSSREGIDRFASRTHAVGLRPGGADDLKLYAPYGLDDLFSFRMVPNRLLNNRTTHETKGARAISIWPELTIEPW